MSEPFTEYQQFTLEPIPDFPEGFTYMDGYDHAPVGEVYVLMSDAVAALAAQATAHEAALAEARIQGAIAGVREMAAIRPARTLSEFREGNAYTRGVSDERARIRKAVEALFTRMWDESQDSPAREEVLAVIDGEDE